MELERIKSLIDAMAASDLAEMEFSHDGWTLRLVRRPAAAARSPAPSHACVAAAALAAPAAPAAPTARPAAQRELLAPLYGVVHLKPGPDEAPFVTPGQAVQAGQTVCVVEAMKVFNEVRAERDAVVDAVLVASGQEVEAGQALVRLR